MNLNKAKGSVLILVLVGTLIISLLGIMALDQTSVEVSIAKNFITDKTALYCAETGIQRGTNELRFTVDPKTVLVNTSESSAYMSEAFKSAIIKSGKITDSTPQYVTGFSAFKTPPPIGVSMEVLGEAAVSLTAWELTISSNLRNAANREARKQINTVVVLLSAEY